MIDDSAAAALVYSAEYAGEVEPAVATAAQPPRYVLRAEGEGQLLASLLAQSQPQFDAAPATADDDCFWLYSSGSTGAPKGAVHRHRDMAVTSQRFGVETLGIREDDVFYSEAKLFFAYGLATISPFRFGSAPRRC
jgi:acyl-coenzyme A synthetase/AMP-(fatty) acid ligase